MNSSDWQSIGDLAFYAAIVAVFAYFVIRAAVKDGVARAMLDRDIRNAKLDEEA